MHLGKCFEIIFHFMFGLWYFLFPSFWHHPNVNSILIGCQDYYNKPHTFQRYKIYYYFGLRKNTFCGLIPRKRPRWIHYFRNVIFWLLIYQRQQSSSFSVGLLHFKMELIPFHGSICYNKKSVHIYKGSKILKLAFIIFTSIFPHHFANPSRCQIKPF